MYLDDIFCSCTSARISRDVFIGGEGRFTEGVSSDKRVRGILLIETKEKVLKMCAWYLAVPDTKLRRLSHIGSVTKVVTTR